MNALSLCGAAVLLSSIGFALREFGYRGAPLFALLCGILLLSSSLEPLRQGIPLLARLCVNEEVRSCTAAALRIVGVGYVCMIAADICRDLGEAGIARTVVLASRISILVIAYPYIERMVNMGIGLLK